MNKSEIENLYQQLSKKHPDPNETIQIIESNANRKIMTIPYGKDIYPYRDLIDHWNIKCREKIGTVTNPKKVFPSLIFKSKYKLYYLYQYLGRPIRGGSVVFATLSDFDPTSLPRNLRFEDTKRLFRVPSVQDPMFAILGYRYASFWEAVLFYNSVIPTSYDHEILLPTIQKNNLNFINGYLSQIQVFTQKIPTIWQPHIIEENGRIRLIYYTFSAFGNIRIRKYTCTFLPKSLRFRQKSEIIATSSGGYVV